MEASVENLPRLLYIGDVPVEASYHGSALLHRLLKNYPHGKLRVVEAGFQSSLPERRLKDIDYKYFAQPLGRLHLTRLHAWHGSLLSLLAPNRAASFRGLSADFIPEAILSITHGFSWITAGALSERLGVPLHLICHDDWPRMTRSIGLVGQWLDRRFGRVYRQAASRFCVSPYMEETYRVRYGEAGSLLYPSRATDCPKFERPPDRLRRLPDHLTVAFAGNIASKAYVKALQSVSEALLPLEGRLVIYGPLTQAQARAIGLVAPNIEFGGLLKSDVLVARLREGADVLFVPMSFEKADRANAEISFPSKLTDSTIPGIPLLICGPDYCSAVRWAKENPGAAEIVSEENVDKLSAALGRLREPVHRWRLGEAALLNGEKFFSHSNAERTFHKALTGDLGGNGRSNS